MDIDFSFTTTTNNQLDRVKLELIVNDEVIASVFPQKDPVKIAYNFDDSITKAHTINIVMSGKTDPATLIELRDLKFDIFELHELLLEDVATYKHNFNGNGEEVSEVYTSLLGCDGIIEFTFTTPVYNWILNNTPA